MCPTIVPLMRETKKEQDIYFTSLIETMKILVATEKPFAKKAVDGIRKIVEDAGYELALLEKYTDKGQLLEAVADVDALIVRSDKVTAEVIAAAKNLKIVVRAGAGYDNVDLAAASARGIVVMNTPGQNSNAVAELALAMMIFMSRNRFTPGTGTELQGKTLGIHAYGNVGRLVGRKGKALGMNVVAYDPFIADGAVFEADGVKRAASVGELYEAADFLSLHIPATAQTRGSIGYELLMSMPKGATLVNTARKEVIDEEGVVRAMTEREDLKYITDIAPDAQAEMAGKFGKRFFATAKKMGAETAEANINAGLAAADSEYLVFLDADDALRPGALQAALDAQNTAPQSFVLWHYTTDELDTAAVTSDTATRPQNMLARLWLDCLLAMPWNKLYRTAPAQQLAFDRQYTLGEDLQFVLDYIDLLGRTAPDFAYTILTAPLTFYDCSHEGTLSTKYHADYCKIWPEHFARLNKACYAAHCPQEDMRPLHRAELTVYAEGVADILRRDPAKRRAVRRDKAYAALRSPWLHALLERMRIEGCYSAYYLPCRWRSIRLVWVMAEARRTGSPLFGKLDWAGYYLLGRRLRRD